MSRIKISEYRAKKLLGDAFSFDYKGRSIDLLAGLVEQLLGMEGQAFVVKVDQAVKKRNKLGLVFVNRTLQQAEQDLSRLKKLGYKWALVEPFVEHKDTDERFVALEREHNGIRLTYSPRGGVSVEEQKEHLQTCLLDHANYFEAQNTTDLDNVIAQTLYGTFIATHMTYLEINPAIINNNGLMPLDAAVEVDSAAVFFVKGAWKEEDTREFGKKTEAEVAVEQLNSKSPASFNLKVLNKDAGIFLLLSGGGASVVVADEFAAQGLHADIANYGEYSGNPNTDETYEYTKQLLSVLISSRAPKKILMIGGGTANFTDISKTFRGVVRAMSEVSDKLYEQNVHIYVRRGGPNHKEGLRAMSEYLLSARLKFMVCGPEKPIAQLVRDIAGVMHV